MACMANLPYAKRLEILGLDALQTKRIKSDLVQCYSIVHGHSCMKPAHFLFYVILVLLEDVMLNCLSLCVVLMCESIVLLTGLFYKLEFVGFSLYPFVRVEFTQACVSLLCYFLLLGMRECLSGPVRPDFCLNKWIWIYLYVCVTLSLKLR